MFFTGGNLLSAALLYLPSILCGVHVMRSGQQMYWLWLLIIAPGLGPLIYFFAVWLPELMGGRTARGFSRAAAAALDPEREYRQAKQALDDTPSLGNQMRIAHALANMGRWSEAEARWAEASHGYGADDPAVLTGHATTLLELGRYAEALAKLEQLKKAGPDGATPQATLLFARAYEGLGRTQEADAAYRACVDRVPGLEAGGRYVAFLAKSGRKADAQIGLTEIDRRLTKIAPPLRGEARQWRDLAARAIAGA